MMFYMQILVLSKYTVLFNLDEAVHQHLTDNNGLWMNISKLVQTCGEDFTPKQYVFALRITAVLLTHVFAERRYGHLLYVLHCCQFKVQDCPMPLILGWDLMITAIIEAIFSHLNM